MPESTFTYQGTQYQFSTESDIGISELRHIKQWYGSELGSYTGLTNRASYGDPDALSCIIWVALRKAGVQRLTEPMRLADFSVGQFMGSFITEGRPVRSPMPPMRLTLDGIEYTFDIDKELTRNTLVQIKDWYRELGSLVEFVTAFLRGDPDAMACTAWIVRNSAGEDNVPFPNQMDFAVGTVIDSYELDPVEEPEEPPVPRVKIDLDGEGEPTSDPPLPSGGAKSSEGTPTPSGGNITRQSPTSSISRRAKPKQGVSLSSLPGYSS